MTFSLKPIKKSVLPAQAASVNTLVVSWKEAAEIKDSVLKEALVIPNKIGDACAAFPPSLTLLGFRVRILSYLLLRHIITGIARINDADFFEHLSDDNFNMLIVNIHTLGDDRLAAPG